MATKERGSRGGSKRDGRSTDGGDGRRQQRSGSQRRGGSRGAGQRGGGAAVRSAGGRSTSTRRGGRADRSGGAATRGQRGREQGLADVFLAELAEFAQAEQQALQFLDDLQGGPLVADETLREAVELLRTDVAYHVEQAQNLLEGVSGAGAPQASGAVEAMVEDFRRKTRSLGVGPATDVLLTTALQKIAHHGIASLGSLAAWAYALGADGAAPILEGMVREKKQADEHLTRVAEDVVGVDLDASSDRGSRNESSAREREPFAASGSNGRSRQPQIGR